MATKEENKQHGKSSKNPWTPEEDAALLQLIDNLGTYGNWPRIAKNMPNRTGKQCRERYLNQLNPSIKKGEWTKEEDITILQLHAALENKWCKYVPYLPGRSDNSIKNRWHVISRNDPNGVLGNAPTADQVIAIPNPSFQQQQDGSQQLLQHNNSVPLPANGSPGQGASKIMTGISRISLDSSGPSQRQPGSGPGYGSGYGPGYGYGSGSVSNGSGSGQTVPLSVPPGWQRAGDSGGTEGGIDGVGEGTEQQKPPLELADDDDDGDVCADGPPSVPFLPSMRSDEFGAFLDLVQFDENGTPTPSPAKPPHLVAAAATIASTATAAGSASHGSTTSAALGGKDTAGGSSSSSSSALASAKGSSRAGTYVGESSGPVASIQQQQRQPTSYSTKMATYSYADKQPQSQPSQLAHQQGQQQQQQGNQGKSLNGDDVEEGDTIFGLDIKSFEEIFDPENPQYHSQQSSSGSYSDQVSNGSRGGGDTNSPGYSSYNEGPSPSGYIAPPKSIPGGGGMGGVGVGGMGNPALQIMHGSSSSSARVHPPPQHSLQYSSIDFMYTGSPSSSTLDSDDESSSRGSSARRAYYNHNNEKPVFNIGTINKDNALPRDSTQQPQPQPQLQHGGSNISGGLAGLDGRQVGAAMSAAVGAVSSPGSYSYESLSGGSSPLYGTGIASGGSQAQGQYSPEYWQQRQQQQQQQQQQQLSVSSYTANDTPQSANATAIQGGTGPTLANNSTFASGNQTGASTGGGTFGGFGIGDGGGVTGSGGDVGLEDMDPDELMMLFGDSDSNVGSARSPGKPWPFSRKTSGAGAGATAGAISDTAAGATVTGAAATGAAAGPTATAQALPGSSVESSSMVAKSPAGIVAVQDQGHDDGGSQARQAQSGRPRPSPLEKHNSDSSIMSVISPHSDISSVGESDSRNAGANATAAGAATGAATGGESGVGGTRAGSFLSMLSTPFGSLGSFSIPSKPSQQQSLEQEQQVQEQEGVSGYQGGVSAPLIDGEEKVADVPSPSSTTAEARTANSSNLDPSSVEPSIQTSAYIKASSNDTTSLPPPTSNPRKKKLLIVPDSSSGSSGSTVGTTDGTGSIGDVEGNADTTDRCHPHSSAADSSVGEGKQDPQQEQWHLKADGIAAGNSEAEGQQQGTGEQQHKGVKKKSPPRKKPPALRPFRGNNFFPPGSNPDGAPEEEGSDGTAEGAAGGTASSVIERSPIARTHLSPACPDSKRKAGFSFSHLPW